MRLIEKLIGKLKGNSSYNWNANYSYRELSVILSERAFQMIRGLYYKVFFKKSSGFLFVGRGVKIRHKSGISCGGNLILSDNITINALSENGIVIGDNVSIGQRSTLLCTGVIAHKGVGIKIGSGTGINEGAFIAGQGGVTIGNNVIIGPGVKIFSENHLFANKDILIKDQGVSRQGVVIGDNCWLGANVTILDGVIIGNGCVIAAGAVVSKSFSENSVLGGIPAKLLKNR